MKALALSTLLLLTPRCQIISTSNAHVRCGACVQQYASCHLLEETGVVVDQVFIIPPCTSSFISQLKIQRRTTAPILYSQLHISLGCWYRSKRINNISRHSITTLSPPRGIGTSHKHHCIICPLWN